MVTRWKVALLGALSCAVLLAACGGGGGDGAGGAASSPTQTLTSLNDTGVGADQCFAAGSNAFVACSSPEARALSTRQDGQLGRDAVAATNASSDGKLGFQFSAVPGGCVRDETTGLTWESKTADGGLSDSTRTYTNYGDGRAGDASEFVSAVNGGAGLCGAADWRLPTYQELNSLLDYGAMAAGLAPWIDPAWFPNTGAPQYWASTLISPIFAATSRVHYVQFNPRGFQSQLGDRSERYGVRLVRGGNALVPPQSRFTASADAQEVTDLQTGLVWRRCAEGMRFAGGSCTGASTVVKHEQALQLASAQAAAAGVAWRLPNAKELLGLFRSAGVSPALDTVAFPKSAVTGLWASTPCESGAAAGVNFDSSGSFNSFCSARDVTGSSVQLVRDPS